MKKIFFFTCLIVVSIQSCVQSGLKKNLNNNCGWDYYNKNHPEIPVTHVRFKRNGECYFFIYNFYNRKQTDSVRLFPEGDNISPKTWSIEGDSVMVIQGKRMKVINYNEDTIRLGYYTVDDSIFLYKNCNTKSNSSYY